MKNTFGQNIGITLFGESHGEAVGVVIDGLTPGTIVDNEVIAFYLSRRRPSGGTDTPRREPDNFEIVSGVFNGRATGTPITIIIPNVNKRSGDYNYGIARPSHADYAAFCKYHGFEDYRGGGHFSGRITAGLVAAGGIIIPALERKGIFIGTHIKKCMNIEDETFMNINMNDELLSDIIKSLKEKTFPVIDDDRGQKMQDEILKVAQQNDSIGGIIETAISGIPKGVGEPWFDSMESIISHIIFSIGGIKGIEFGLGFGFDGLKGSQANDNFEIFNNEIVTKTNNNGGINGGITNGMPIVFSSVVKPTPSIGLEQSTVDFKANKNCNISINGRHDPAIIRRICPVIDSVTAIAIYDMLVGRYGTDYFRKEGI